MGTPLLDPEAIARGESLGLLARKIVEGYRVGEHRSPFHGFAIEFAQHREYSPGDDTRHLDWKVLGRSDRYYIKQYEQDTNYTAHLVIDGSKSMNYGSTALTKMHFAKVLGACLAHTILAQRDAVALALFDEEMRDYQKRTDQVVRIRQIADRLANFRATGQTNLAKALEQVARAAGRRGIVILISDLFDDASGLENGLRLLSYAGNEVIVFHTLDPYELTFPLNGTWKFRDLEGTATVQTSPADIRKSYLQQLAEFRNRIRAMCEKFAADYVLADTGKSVAEVLAGYLAFRRTVGKR